MEDLSTIEQSSEQIDSGWLEKIPRMAGTFEYLTPTKEAMEDQKARFMAGEIDAPQFEYPKIAAEDLDKQEEALLALKESLSLNKEERRKLLGDREEIEVAKQAYHWRINQMIAEIRMLRSCANGDYKKFQRYSEFAYGDPQREIFEYIKKFTREMIDSVGSEGVLGSAAKEISEFFPETKSSITNVNEETFNKADERFREEVNTLVDVDTPKTNFLDADQIATGFEQALQKLEAKDWCVIVDRESGRTTISVDQSSKKINIPSSIKLTRDRFCEFIVHEIGTHVARRLKGERTKLTLLGVGLDRYDLGDEGVATFKEQIYRGNAEGYTRHGLYLGICLAYGLDGQKRGFRDVYGILEKYNYFLNLQDGLDREKASSKAQDIAWTQTVRIFRGTDGSPGVCYTKDLTYLEGNIGVWNVIEKNTNELHRFNVGKYDPNNLRHIAILDRLGISDEDLSGLEEE